LFRALQVAVAIQVVAIEEVRVDAVGIDGKSLLQVFDRLLVVAKADRPART
jgi:hypothetical protein